MEGGYNREDLFSRDMYGEMYGLSSLDLNDDDIFRMLQKEHSITNRELQEERSQAYRKERNAFKRFAFEEDLWKLIYVLYPRLLQNYQQQVDLLKREYLAKTYLDVPLIAMLEQMIDLEEMEQLWEKHNLDDPVSFQGVVRDLLWASERDFMLDQEAYYEALNRSQWQSKK